MADSNDATGTNGTGANPFAIDYNKLGSTDTGRAWLEKAIHPPGQAVGQVRGMPDNETYPSTVVEFRNTETVASPNSTDVWNCLFLVQPNAEYPFLYWKWASSESDPTIATLATNDTTVVNPSYNFDQWDYDVARWRQLYGSATIELNAPAVADQGMVYCAQQRLEQLDSSVYESAGAVGLPQRNAQAIMIESLPTQPNVLAQISPKFYKQKATKGAFTVLGMCQPVNRYVVGNSPETSYGSTDQFHSHTPATWTIGNRLVQWENAPARRVNTGNSQNLSSSWVLFRGIAPAATLEMKMIHGYEMQASIGSSFALFVEPSAEPDPDAIDAYYRLRHGMADAYPASYNFFGSLLAGLSSLIPKAIEWLAPAAKAVAPVVGQQLTNWGSSPRNTPPDTDAALRRLESRMANLEVGPTPRPTRIPAPTTQRGRPRRRRGRPANAARLSRIPRPKGRA